MRCGETAVEERRQEVIGVFASGLEPLTLANEKWQK